MKELKWSDFEWFKKKLRVHLDDEYFICSEKKGRDQKLIFPLKNLNKYLTFSLSNRYLDLHVTNENRSIPQRNVMDIQLRNAKKIISDKFQQLKSPIDFIPLRDKSLKKMILVNPLSKAFIKNVQRMDKQNVMPIALIRNRIHSMRNNHGKILFAYDVYGRFKGIVRCNHSKHGFEYIQSKVLINIQNNLVNMSEVKKRLHAEGLKENSHSKYVWQKWYKIIDFFDDAEKLMNHFRSLLSSILSRNQSIA